MIDPETRSDIFLSFLISPSNISKLSGKSISGLPILSKLPSPTNSR